MQLAHICMDEVRLAWPLIAFALSWLLYRFPSLRLCRAYKNKCKGRSDGHEH